MLYFIHALAALSGNNFYGVWLIEILLLTINLTLLFKIACFVLPESWAFVTVLLFPTLMMGTNLGNFILWFREGDSAEEFALPCLFFLIFSLFKYLGERKLELSLPNLYLQGLFMGGLFWIKYTMIGSYVSFFLLLGLILLVQRKFAFLIKTIGGSLVGFLTVSLPILAYFTLNHALNSLFSVYFLLNLQAYRAKLGFGGMLQSTAHGLVKELIAAPFLIVLLLTLGYLFVKMRKGLLTVFIVVCFASLIFATLAGGTALPYYFLVLIPFFALGIVGLGLVFNSVKFDRKILGILTVFSLFLPFLTNRNFFYSRFFPNNSDQSLQSSQKQSAQVQFAKLIKHVKQPTLLNYGMLDSGFYLASETLPHTRYFEQQKIPYTAYPANNDEQVQVIIQAQVDFVVKLAGPANQGYGINPNSRVNTALQQHYRLLARHEQTYQGMKKTFELYQRKDLD